MTGSDRQDIQARLEEQRIRLLTVIDDLGAGPRQGTWTGMLGEPGDMADVASLRSARDDTEALIEASRQRLDDLDTALARIDDGTYGTCGTCGRQIAAERLEALPFTTFCVDHAHAGSRARAG